FLLLDISLKKLKSIWFWDLFVMVIASILFGFFAESIPDLGGVIGFEMNSLLQDYLGKTGTLLTLIFGIVIYLIFKLQVSPDTIKSFFERTKKEIDADLSSATPVKPASSDYNLEEFAVKDEFDDDQEIIEEPILKKPSKFEVNRSELKPTISHSSEIALETSPKPTPPTPPAPIAVVTPAAEPELIHTSDEAFVIEKATEEDVVVENLAAKLVSDFGLFDPTLDLPHFKFPTLD